jgi:thioredoxin-like negative regulator of GroEL
MALTLQEITSEEQFKQVTASASPEQVFVLYFHTPWAAPCVQMNTILTALASTYPSSRATDLAFLSINAEDLPEISEEYDVTAVPFTVISKGGKAAESVSGSDVTKVRAAVEKHAGVGGNAAANGVNGNGSAIPPALKADPHQRAQSSAVAKDAPKESDSQTAPSNGDKEELNERLGKLVKAA